MNRILFTAIICGLTNYQTVLGTTGKDSAKTLDFDAARQSPKEIKLSSIASSISYIPLETGDFTLTPGQARITTMNGDYILAQDNEKLLLFSISGKQIADIKQIDSKIIPAKLLLPEQVIISTQFAVRMLSQTCLC